MAYFAFEAQITKLFLPSYQLDHLGFKNLSLYKLINKQIFNSQENFTWSL